MLLLALVHGQRFRNQRIMQLMRGPELVRFGDNSLQAYRITGAAKFVEEEIEIPAFKTVHNQHFIRERGCRIRNRRSQAGKQVTDTAVLTVGRNIDHGEIQPKGKNLKLITFPGIRNIEQEQFSHDASPQNKSQ